MKLVREKLYEQEGQYSEDTLRNDFQAYIDAESVKISDENKAALFSEVIIPEYTSGMIKSTSELFNVMSDKINSYVG